MEDRELGELRELERAMRAGLKRRADGTDVTVPVLARARGAARRRPTSRQVGAGLAAASVVAVVMIGVVLARGPVEGDRAADLPPVVPGAGEWRTETWGDLQVEVPADWGYGGAPDPRGVACFPGASLDAAGRPVRGRTAPPGYVGRPIVLTDECMSPDAGGPVIGPYVWLGAELESGVVELGDGFVQETVGLADTAVTVATRDETLRQRIIASVSGSESCLSQLNRSGPIAHDVAADPDATPTTLRVCAYRLGDERSSGWELTYATDLDAVALLAYLDAVAAGDPPRDQCPTIDYQLGEAVILEILDADGQVLRQDSVNASGACAGIAVDSDQIWELKTTSLTPSMARPWVVGGVGAVMHGDPELGLIGPQG